MTVNRRNIPSSGSSRRNRRPAATPEAQESRMISLAEKLAERQLEEGSASAQVIAHYLKLGSSRERLEQKRLQGEVELQAVKAEALRAQARSEELMDRAIKAFRGYQGLPSEGEEREDYDDES